MSVKHRVEEIINVLKDKHFLTDKGEIAPWSSDLYKLVVEELNK